MAARLRGGAGGVLVAGYQRSTSAAGQRSGVQHEPGTAVVPLPPGRVLRRCRAAGADVVVTVLAGSASLAVAGEPPRRLGPGESAGCPRGVAFRLAAGHGATLLRVTARPPGPEAVLAALAAAPPPDDGTLLAVAADGGVELLLDPVTGPPAE